ncbi:uncharacterized protein B0J16DRAFT_399637 [Fusarium flagelliforme]|uniref:uncharacterized protein n=1 Tax=Fusarium flagelliforme TaxID=2675880 RepID=UPI001E8DA89A|nr:uncharacterized protein B0J16DRAFT_399637 [Fusarium flagelliforme]KAH7185803.1 hypothetical protein B0J16DRAFT_399637 [Fusarium flagelliforme]
MISRCTNPNREPNVKKETERSILLPSLIEDIRPTISARRRAERERNARRRRARRRRVQRPLLTPRTYPSIPTGSLTPSSSEGLTNRVRSSQDLIIPRNYTPDTQAHVPVEPDDSTQESYGVEHNTFTATPSAAVHESYHQNPNSASAPRTIDFDIPGVDEEYVLLEPDATVSQAETGIPSTIGDLVLDSSREYEDHFKPRNMNQIQLEDHLEEISREVQQRVYFNNDLKYSFMSYDYLWRIRTASGRPPHVVDAPPVYREILTPNGVLAPVRYLLYADLDWESSGLPFPRSKLYFMLYRGDGTIYDTKPVLGQNWSKIIEGQAAHGTSITAL